MIFKTAIVLAFTFLPGLALTIFRPSHIRLSKAFLGIALFIIVASMVAPMEQAATHAVQQQAFTTPKGQSLYRHLDAAVTTYYEDHPRLFGCLVFGSSFLFLAAIDRMRDRNTEGTLNKAL